MIIVPRLDPKFETRPSAVIRLKTAFIAVFFSLGFVLNALAAPTFDKTQGNDLLLKDGDKTLIVKTPYSNPEFKAFLGGENGLPLHALYEAKSCEKCPDDVKSLYLQRVDGKQKAMQFVYPGKIVDTKKGQVVYESRGFYGQCLPKVPLAYVVHQREHVGRRGYQRSVFVAQVTPEGATEQLMERKLPTVTTTLQLVKRKVCFEIAGRSRSVLKKPLDLTPRSGMDEDDVDEDDDSEDKPEIKAEPAIPPKSE